MQKLLNRLIPWKIRWKGLLAEALLFLAAYIIWLIFRSPESSNRLLIGDLAVLAPLVTSVLLTFMMLPQISPQSQRTWQFVGLALLCWATGNGIRTFYEGLRGVPLPNFSAADVFNILAYPFFFYALSLYPFENRYAPSRFRFLLDATISSGVVAALGWLILAQPGVSIGRQALVPLVYPIVDLILLMILLNMLLANRKARRTTFLWGVGLLAFFISDYVYSILAQFSSYQAGGLGSLGWVAGGLIFCLGSVIEADPSPKKSQAGGLGFDIGARIQNILPVTLVLALFWFVIVEWQISGEISVLGLWMSLLLALALIVRVGIRAGEAELYKYWQLFSSLAEPTFICDKRGKILLANPAMVRALALRDENQVVGMSLTTIFDDEPPPADLLDRASRQECSLEISLRPHRTPFLLALSPIFSDGRKVLIAGAAHDLSEQKRQQEEVQKAYNELQVVYRKLEELNEQLEQKVVQRTGTLQEAYRRLEAQNKMLQELDQLKSDFVSMVSHELRTPLTSLNGGLELLLKRKGRSVADREPLALMKNEVQRLTRFVENILNLSAMEAGRLEAHPVPLSLSAIVEDVDRQFRAMPGAERIRINLPEELPPVLADPGFLESVFNHLVDNALKYAPQGEVMVDAVPQRGRLRIQVTDSGPGIPKEKQPLLFQRFQRLDAKDSQSVYGYGLGLYLSQRMLHVMGSDLAFEEPPKGGARFYFYLKVTR
ncbi:MAG TPA: PAS domain-containing sensor histidine kinase [Anaerolineales bacterium]